MRHNKTSFLFLALITLIVFGCGGPNTQNTSGPGGTPTFITKMRPGNSSGSTTSFFEWVADENYSFSNNCIELAQMPDGTQQVQFFAQACPTDSTLLDQSTIQIQLARNPTTGELKNTSSGTVIGISDTANPPQYVLQLCNSFPAYAGLCQLTVTNQQLVSMSPP